ncbi:MAG: helix-turn-helix domain-containing protein, partial [Ignavibacteriales bacterium]|nr:helix-turn-helix domain-containing protein [Ignavibacteriales bacterium]
MNTNLTMNTKERERLKVLARIDRHELTVADAAESLHISERQIYRIVARYRAESDAG